MSLYLRYDKQYQRVYCSIEKFQKYVPDIGSEIFVRNIPPTADDTELLKFFHQAGKIFQLRIMISAHESQAKRNFLYVTYMDAETAKKALEMLNEKKFGSQRLSMEISVNNCRIFVGGIPTRKSRDEVWIELKRCGVRNILDVIMYRSYTDRAENRGFIFVEFRTHDEAAYFRAKYHESLRLFGKHVVVDWSVPIPEIDPEIMKAVKIIYLRNLPVWEDRLQLEKVVTKFLRKDRMEKLYKFKNYAFVHLKTRTEAEVLLKGLKEYYRNEPVDVEWAKPPNKFTCPEYRQYKVESMSTSSRSRNSSQSSTVSSISSSSPGNLNRSFELVSISRSSTEPRVLNISDVPPEIFTANNMSELQGLETSPVPPSTLSSQSPVSCTNDRFSLYSTPPSLDSSFGHWNQHFLEDEENNLSAPHRKVLRDTSEVPSPLEYINNACKNKRDMPLVFGQLPCAMPEATYLTNWNENFISTPGSSDSACPICNFQMNL